MSRVRSASLSDSPSSPAPSANGSSTSSSASSANKKGGMFSFLSSKNNKRGDAASYEDSQKNVRRLSTAGMTSMVIQSSSKQGSTKSGKGGKGGSGSAGAKGGGSSTKDMHSGPFVIKHPRYGRREYDHHFVPLSVVVGTWNVGGQLVDQSEIGGLRAWLIDALPKLPGGGPLQQRKKRNDDIDDGGDDDPTRNCPDLYVLGFQEIVEFNAKNVMLSSEESDNRGRAWVDLLESVLPREHQYGVLTSKSMVGLFLCVLMKESKMRGVAAVRATNVGTGLMGTGGNKGSVAVSLRYGLSSLCFMTAHLAAHRENVEGRCSDYKNIMARCDFGSQKADNADAASKGCEWVVVKKCPLYANNTTQSTELRGLALGETLTELKRVLKKDGRTWVQFKDGWCPTKDKGLMGAKLIVPRFDEKPAAGSRLSAGSGGSGGGGGVGDGDGGEEEVAGGGAGGDTNNEDDDGDTSAKTPLDHDLCFFFGDLNFRLEKPIGLDEAYVQRLDRLNELRHLRLQTSQRGGRLDSDLASSNPLLCNNARFV
jgi:hypothetical protein